MKIKTRNLTGRALDWAVARCEDLTPVMRHSHMREKASKLNYKGDLGWHLSSSPDEPITVTTEGVTQPIPYYSTDWAQGGPILTQARISRSIGHSGQWIAYWTDGYTEGDEGKLHMQCDRSELVAGLRCYVAMELGDEVEIPEELT